MKSGKTLLQSSNGEGVCNQELRPAHHPPQPIPTKPTDQFPSDAWIWSVFEGWFDPCPLDSSPTVDGLTIDWAQRTYVNPPYSDPLPWVIKGIEEHKKGKTVVFLVKLDPTTKWSLALKLAGAHRLDVGERLHHGAKYAAPFPSALYVLDGREQ